MLLRTQAGIVKTDESKRPRQVADSERDFGAAVDFAATFAQRYERSPLSALLEFCRPAVSEREVSVVVVGRFKAGKSSFLNHFTRRQMLPVGVVPVTADVATRSRGSQSAGEALRIQQEEVDKTRAVGRARNTSRSKAGRPFVRGR